MIALNSHFLDDYFKNVYTDTRSWQTSTRPALRLAQAIAHKLRVTFCTKQKNKAA